MTDEVWLHEQGVFMANMNSWLKGIEAILSSYILAIN